MCCNTLYHVMSYRPLAEDMLHGDVPKPDWKKLNRKATFKVEASA